MPVKDALLNKHQEQGIFKVALHYQSIIVSEKITHTHSHTPKPSEQNKIITKPEF